MARGKGDAAASYPTRLFNNAALKNVSLNLAGKSHVQSLASIQQAIDRNWESMPPQAKAFLLEIEALDSSFHKLAKFWSSPSVIEYTRGGIAGKSVCGASWFIALNYLKLGKVQAARVLTLNGSFIHQCFNTPIEGLVEMCGPDFNRKVSESQVPIFSRGMDSVQTPQTMEAYLQKGLPKRYQHMMTNLVNISSPDNVMEYVDQIGDDWSGSSRGQRSKPASPTPGETQIQLILVDDANDAERTSFDIGASTNLKSFFNDYAEKRGVSLRSLRFSHNDRTMFLSNVGNKTPEQLNMRDQDVVTVHDATASRGTGVSTRAAPVAKKPSATKSSRKKASARRKKKQHEPRRVVTTLMEYKAQHSKRLSKLHEEAQPRLKEIRTRLNAIDLERQPPKQKKRKKKKKKKKDAAAGADLQILPPPGVGGKAGKPYFAVQVGEVHNLYKTTKPSALSSQLGAAAAATLDLHGCTREEALRWLDGHLETWVDRAMRGSYPFVTPAVIVCGGGNQVLSETVQKWIRLKKNVCNAPKSAASMQKFGHALRYC